MKNKNLLIADSGSTKTDWLFVGDDDSVVQFQSAGMNPFYQNREEVAAVLQNEVIPKLPGGVEKIFFYGAGCANATASKPIYEGLVEVVATASEIEVASDMLGAARGLCGKEPGLACILGTGANNAFYDGANIVNSIGSLGFWLGDEGSGSYLGKTLVVHFLQNELPKDLHDLFTKTYPEIDRLSVLEYAYKKPFPNRYFAGFSKFIAEHVADMFVQKMVSDGFDLFVEKYILKHRDAEKYPVHFTGSIAFYYQDILRGSLSKHGMEPGRVLKSPLVGLKEYHS